MKRMDTVPLVKHLVDSAKLGNDESNQLYNKIMEMVRQYAGGWEEDKHWENPIEAS
jgi:polyhydroxyalkanoate synthesis regulator phasin